MKTKKTRFSLLGFFLVGALLLSVGFTSALLEKSITMPSLKESLQISDSANIYPAISIKSNWDLPLISEDLADLVLTDHITSCSDNCYSIFNINTYKDSALVESVTFYTIDGTKRIEQPIRSYKFYYSDKQETKIIPDYTEQCSNIGYATNGSILTSCRLVESGIHVELNYNWQEYEEGEILPAGNYYVKIEGNKRPDRVVDWIITTQNKVIDSWSVWSTSNTIIGYYTFDDLTSNRVPDYNNINNGNFLDVNGGANSSGVINGDFKTIVPTGTSYVNTSIKPNGNELSINFWTQSDNYNSDGYSMLMSTAACNSAPGTNGMFRMYSNGANNIMVMNVRDGTSAKEISTTANALKSNQWNMVTYTLNATNGSVYVNGRLNQTIALASFATGGTATLYPNWRVSGQCGADGIVRMLDELLVMNRTLTPTEVTTLYNNGAGSRSILGSSVAFNSPIDNYISPISTVDFNCTATINGATFVNMSIYTNKTGTFTQSNTSTVNGGIQKVTFADGTYLTGCKPCDSDGACGASTNRTVTIDTLAPVNTIFYPTGTILGLTNGATVVLNFSVVHGTGLDTCQKQYNNVNTTISCTANSTFTYAAGINTVRIWANDSAGNIGTTDSTWSVPVLINSVGYSNSTLSGSTEQFTLNITYDNTAYQAITGYLTYNNTNYTLSSRLDTPTNLYFSRSITVPIVSTITNKSFFFGIVLSNSTSSLTITSATYNQTVTPIFLDNCSAYTNKIINMDLYDEAFNTYPATKINGNITIALKIFDIARQNQINVYNNSFKYNTTTISVCISNVSGTYSMDYDIAYYGDIVYQPRTRVVQNMTLNSAALNQNISLYDVRNADSNAFSVTVRNSGIYLDRNLVVDTQKQYLGLNSFISVESSKTDSDGVAIAHLIPTSAVYNFIVSYQGQVLGTFNNFQPACQNSVTGQCEITLNLDEAIASMVNFNSYGNIDIAFLLTNVTSTLYGTFITSDSQSHNVGMVVTTNDGFDNNTFCNTTLPGTSGTLICNIPVSYRLEPFYADIYSDGRYIGSYYFTLDTTPPFQGVDIIIELLLFSTLVLLFMSSPILMVIGGIAGFVLSMIIFSLNTGAKFSIIVWFLIAGGIIIFKMWRNR